ncbi:MAG: alanyl-tRNA editing protein [Candidatus Competibacterales bacterium]
MTDKLYLDDAYLPRCEAVVTAVDHTPQGPAVTLDRTVFYAKSGGQPGDTGHLTRADGRRWAVGDTVGDAEGRHWHHLAPPTPASGAETPLAVGDAVVGELDWPRRYRHMRMHTCLHLLCSLVEAGVTGGSIAAERGRLDFDLPEATLDKDALTQALNERIAANYPVAIGWIDEAELDARPELVRTMAVQPPRGQGRVRMVEIKGIDYQPCGGTHVATTAEVGRVAVVKIEKKSRHNRRVNLAFVDDPPAS